MTIASEHFTRLARLYREAQKENEEWDAKRRQRVIDALRKVMDYDKILTPLELAAPEMLETLKAVVSTFEERASFDGDAPLNWCAAIVRKARTVIAKAEGHE